MNLIPALVLAGLSLFPMASGAAERKNNAAAHVEFIGSEQPGASFVRPNFTYTLPFDVNGYTFFEVYRDGGYFDKTILNKQIATKINVNSEVIHGTGLKDRIGVGLNYSLPTPKGSFLRLKLLPVWFNGREGHEDRIMASYSGSVNLPFGFRASGFGDVKFSKEAEPQWGYGEAAFGRQFDTNNGVFGAYYNPILRKCGDGKLLPQAEHAFSVSYKF